MIVKNNKNFLKSVCVIKKITKNKVIKTEIKKKSKIKIIKQIN